MAIQSGKNSSRRPGLPQRYAPRSDRIKRQTISLNKSRQVALALSISATFFAREPAFNCFSRKIAVDISSYNSK